MQAKETWKSWRCWWKNTIYKWFSNYNCFTTTNTTTKISEVENKIVDDAKYIITLKFNRLTAESFTARLKQASEVIRTGFGSKLVSFNRKLPWIKQNI